MNKAPNYIVVATFSKRMYAEQFCNEFNVPFNDVIWMCPNGMNGFEARAYDDHDLQGISQDQRKALIAHHTRNIV